GGHQAGGVSPYPTDVERRGGWRVTCRAFCWSVIRALKRRGVVPQAIPLDTHLKRPGSVTAAAHDLNGRSPACSIPIQRPAPASANLCPLSLCLRAILLLTLFVARLQAQGSSSGANLGAAFPKHSIALETTRLLACSIGD